MQPILRSQRRRSPWDGSSPHSTEGTSPGSRVFGSLAFPRGLDRTTCLSENLTAVSKNRSAQPLYPRHLLGLVERGLQESPVVTVVGARQVGKSTLVCEVIRRGHQA